MSLPKKELGRLRVGSARRRVPPPRQLARRRFLDDRADRPSQFVSGAQGSSRLTVSASRLDHAGGIAERRLFLRSAAINREDEIPVPSLALRLHEFPIPTIEGKQLVVRPHLGDPAVIEHHNAIRRTDGR